MPQFRYTARDPQGQLVDGVVTANDRSAAIAQVEQQRYVPIKIQAAGDDAAAARPNSANAPKALPANSSESTSPAKAQSGKTEGGKALAVTQKKTPAKATS